MLKGWKTLIFNLALTIVGALETFNWTNVLGSDDRAGVVVAGIGVVGAVLRLMTNTPAFKSTP